jgi:uncharacterized membrane protein
MDGYLLLKFAHVVLAIFAVGSNLTYGIWLALAAGDPERTAFALRGIRTIDRAANAGYGLLLVTGLALAWIGAIPFEAFWIAASLALYVGALIFGIAVYAPVVRRQAALLETHGPASPEYRAVAAQGTVLGIALTIDVLAIVFLMVVKPTL